MYLEFMDGGKCIYGVISYVKFRGSWLHIRCKAFLQD